MADAVLEVEARLKDFITQNLNGIEGKLNQFATNTTKTSAGMSNAFAGVAGSLRSFAMQFGPAAITAGVLAGAMGKLRESLAFADQLDKLNRQYGLSTEFLQKLNAIAGVSGSSLGGLAMGVKDLTLNLGKLKSGDKELTSIFSKLGITADGRKIEDVYVEIMSKMGDMTDDTERMTVATAIFGRGAREAMATAVQGADGFKKAYEEAADGVVRLTPSEIAQLDAAGDAFTRLGQNATVAAGKIISALGNQFDVMARLIVRRESAESISDSYTIKALASEKKRNELFEFRAGLLREIAAMEGNIAKNRSMGLDDSGMEKVLRRLDEVKTNAAKAGKELSSLSDKKTGVGSFGITVGVGKDVKEKKLGPGGDFDAQVQLYEKVQALKKKADDAEEAAHQKLLKRLEEEGKWEEEAQILRDKIEENKLKKAQKSAAAEDALMGRMQNAAMQNAQSLNALMVLGVQKSRANAQEKKNIMTGIAVMQNAAAQGGAAMSIWTTPGGTWQEKLAESIAVSAALFTSGAIEIATIRNAQFARGTRSAPGGISLVGENGPELMNIPGGASIYNNYETRQMLGGASIYNNNNNYETRQMLGGNNISLQLNVGGGRVDSDAADKITGSLESLGRALVQADRRGFLDEYKMKSRN